MRMTAAAVGTLRSQLLTLLRVGFAFFSRSVHGSQAPAYLPSGLLDMGQFPIRREA